MAKGQARQDRVFLSAVISVTASHLMNRLCYSSCLIFPRQFFDRRVTVLTVLLGCRLGYVA